MNEFLTGEGWTDRLSALVNMVTMAAAVVTLGKLLSRDKARIKEIEALTKLAIATQRGVELQHKAWLDENRPDFQKNFTDKSKGDGSAILHLKNLGKRAIVSGVEYVSGNTGFGHHQINEHGITETNAFVVLYFIPISNNTFKYKLKFQDIHHNNYTQLIEYGYPLPEATNMEFTVYPPELEN